MINITGEQKIICEGDVKLIETGNDDGCYNDVLVSNWSLICAIAEACVGYDSVKIEITINGERRQGD